MRLRVRLNLRVVWINPPQLSPNTKAKEKNWNFFWLQFGALHNRKKKRVLCNMSECVFVEESVILVPSIM